MDLIGVDNVDNKKHFVFPVKHIRYITVEKETSTPKYYVKVLGFRDRISISEEMFNEVRTAMESL
jgi:hypothetical protein